MALKLENINNLISDDLDKRNENWTEIDTTFGLKADKAQEGWIEPTLLNGWIWMGAGYETVGYMKDQFGFVHLKGIVKSGVIGQMIFVLPAGYRPAGTQTLPLNSNGAFGNGAVLYTGAVTMYSGSATYVSLNGITFKAV